MDAISSTASVFAVISLAVQLAETANKLYEFWASVKDAPDTVQGMVTDLELLSSVLSRIALEVQSSTPDETVIAVLKNCCVKLQSLTAKVDKLEPGFTSRSATVRKWSAVKAVLKSGKLEKMLATVEGIKTTLILAQQTFYGRLNRLYHESHQQAMTSIHQTIGCNDLEQVSTTIAASFNEPPTIQDQIKEVLAKTISNPVHRFGFQKALEKMIQDTVAEAASSDSRQDFSGSSGIAPLTTPQSEETPQRMASSPCQVRNECEIERHSFSVVETVFGTIHVEVKNTSKRILSIGDSPTYPRTPLHENSRTFVFSPASWLVKLGLSFSLHIGIRESSIKGWSHTLTVNRPVPDDALIFDFARQGNLAAMRSLLSRGLGSVRDVDSYGRTALWFAARGRHVKLCEFLIGAGADKHASMHKGVEGWNMDFERTPLLAIARGPRNDLKNATDMLRLFAECIDLTDENSHVWPLIIALSPIMVTGGEPAVLIWLLRTFSSDIKPRFHRYEFATMLDYWMRSEVEEVSELLTSMGSCQINAVCHPNGFSILHHTIARFQDPLLYLKKGANPHFIGLELDYSPHWESPTSLAMLHSVMFETWGRALLSLNVDLKEFVRLEMSQQRSPLLKAGWNAETLLSLFDYQGRGPLWEGFYHARLVTDYERCSDCFGDSGFVWVEPKWFQKLEAIKRRIDYADEPGQSRIQDGFPKVAEISTYDDTSSPAVDDMLFAKLELEGSDDGSLDFSDDDRQMAMHDRTTPGEVDILELHFQDEEILCMRCWENYKDRGYNNADSLHTVPRRGSRPAKKTDISYDEHLTHVESQGDDYSSDGSLTDQEYSPFLIHT